MHTPPWLARGLLVGWVVGVLALCGALLTFHLLPLPTPSLHAPPLERSLERLAQRAPQGEWLAVHVVYEGCKCSRQVMEHLLTTARPRGVSETVLAVGDLPPDTLARLAARFHLERTTSARLKADFDVEAGPLLIVADPTGRPTYVGGYTARKQALEIQDLPLIAAAMTGDPAAPLPLYGCAIHPTLARALDPLGLKPPPPP